MIHRTDPRKNSVDNRRGSVLLVVLAIVVLLSLAAWKYCDAMLAEYEATSAHARQIELRVLVDSGVAWTQARVCRTNRQRHRQLYGDPASMDSAPSITNRVGNTLHQSFTAASTSPPDDSWHGISFGDGRFSVLHVAADDSPFDSQLQPRSGPYDLCGLIDINSLCEIDKRRGRETSRRFLMALPRMTVDVADSLLEFLVAAANSAAATGRGNRPITRLSQLLRVPGVSVADLYAEDLNQNGILDPGEDTNGDGRLQSGWSRFLTTISGEANCRPDGTRRINLNQMSLAALYDQIEQDLGPRLAQFVVAFRMHGALSDLSRPAGPAPTAAAQRQAALQRSRRQRDDIVSHQASVGSPADLERGGLDLSVGPVFRIESLIDLFGTSVRTLVDGQDTVLSAPWSSDTATVLQQLPKLMEHLTTSDRPVIHGRINVLTARRTVLLAVPGMTPQGADLVLSERSRLKHAPDSIGWLLDQGIVSHSLLRGMAPFINVGGDFFRATVIAELSTGADGRNTVRSLSGSTVKIDAARAVPRILSHRPLDCRECRIRLEGLKQTSLGLPKLLASRTPPQPHSRFSTQ